MTDPIPVSDDRSVSRSALERHWLSVTRSLLPSLAKDRRWPIRADHGFQRVLLDDACGGVWYDHIVGRPAYRHAPDIVLRRACAAGVAAACGDLDLVALNARSLAWRRERSRRDRWRA